MVELFGRHVLSRYTRNGELLGDGFVPVYESNLVPVVGFHSNGESVRINFGVVPFAYEVRVSTATLRSRNLCIIVHAFLKPCVSPLVERFS